MSKFKIGDRVRYNGRESPFKDKIGTIVYIGSIVDTHSSVMDCDIGVRFDDMIPCAHSLGGKCDNQHGWWFYDCQLSLVEKEPRFNVIITSVGDVTTAKLLHGKKMEKEVTVKRYFKDEYSEKEAVKAVCAKLFGEDKPEKEPEPAGINCKAVCIRDNEVLCLTRGKIYEFSDGKCVDDAGDYYPIYCGLKIENYSEPLFADNFVKLVESDE
ncbi:MAG: hypothetical protein ACI3XQ_02500 [Eubacteriales bacterium]